MPAFAQRVKQPKTPAPSSLDRGPTAEPANPASDWVQTETQIFGAGSPGIPPAHFDLSRIHIHPPAAGTSSPKLPVNRPGDEYEQEADRVADRVMRMPEAPVSPVAAPPPVSRKSVDGDDSDEEEKLQRSPLAAETAVTVAPASVREVLRSPGQPLEAGARRFLEDRFGREFAHVRVHADATAGQSADAVHARAYTVGSHIVFGGGWYAPASPEGRRLLAHELTHVVQQSGPSKDHRQVHGAPAVQRFLRGSRIQRFGEPENLPELTYISGMDPSGHDARKDAFLKEANDYHQFWGLKPKTINSMEELVNDLAKGTGALNRIRIVSHAWEERLFFPLFAGTPPGIDPDTLKAAGESETALLAQLLRQTANFTVKVDVILGVLRDTNDDVLAPFGLDVVPSTPSRPVRSSSCVPPPCGS